MSTFKQGGRYPSSRGRRIYTVESVEPVGEGRYSYVVSFTPDFHNRKPMKLLDSELAQLVKSEEDIKERERRPTQDHAQVWLSASQIGSYRRCKRRWAFEYIDGEAALSTTSQMWGTELHSCLEHYLKTGTWKGAADIIATAQQGMHVLPMPGKNVLVEHEIKLSLKNIRSMLIGYTDLYRPKFAADDDRPCISDHKSTKDLRYALSPADLETDVQANIYAAYAMEHTGKLEAWVQWLYYVARPSAAKTSTPDGRPRNPRGFREVRRLKTAEEVMAQMDGILADCAQMAEHKRGADVWASSIEGSVLACQDFGGCPHRGICDVAQSSSLGAHLTQARVNAPKSKESAVSLLDIINRKQAQKSEPVVVQAVGVNPPPVVQTQAAVIATEPEVEVQSLDTVDPQWLKRLASGHKPRNLAEAEWRKTVQLDTSDLQVVPEVPAPSEAPKEKPAPAIPEKNKKPASTEGHTADVVRFLLFVDALPAKLTNGHKMLDLTEMLRPFKAQIQEEAKVPHWNLVQYRQGEAMLATLLAQALQKAKPEGIMYVDSRSDEWKACGTALTEVADLVVRGV